MKPLNVRKVAIGFALISTIYWMTVQAMWTFLIDPQVPVSVWFRWLGGSLPPMLYALFCLFFCHRLARSMGLAARQETFR
ncbi:MAG: hypothetical protein J7499_17750 [Sphingopyxis sp.]|nr:hypothetical protein [Sphingopyxis sp.]